MPAKRVTADEWEDEIRKRLALDRRRLRAAALEACAQGEAAAVAKTHELGLVDQEHFIQGWGHRRIRGGAELGNNTPHAPVLEHGRRPGRPGPPLAPILAWVRRKLVANGEVEEADAEHVARLIRWEIHHRGTKPHKILGGMQGDLKRWFIEEAKRRLSRKADSAG